MVILSFTLGYVLLPLRGVLDYYSLYPGCLYALPWAMCFCAYSAYVFKFAYYNVPLRYLAPLSPWRGAGGEAFFFWRGVGVEA